MPRWLQWTLLTLVFWGGWGVISKPLSTSMSPWHVQALSTFGLLPVVLILGLRNPGREHGAGNGSTNLKQHLWRGVIYASLAGIFVCLGNVACYQALDLGGKAAAVTPLTSLYPIVTIILGVIFLGERLTWRQITGIVLSLVAIYIFNVGSDSSFLSRWLLLALIPVVLWGVGAFLQKLSTLHIASELSTLAFLAAFVPVAGVIAVMFAPTWTLGARTWVLLLLLGLFFGLGNFTLIRAYASAGKASVVTPLASLYSVVTIFLAVLLLHERMTAREWAGIIVALAGIFALAQEPRASPGSAVQSGD